VARRQNSLYGVYTKYIIYGVLQGGDTQRCWFHRSGDTLRSPVASAVGRLGVYLTGTYSCSIIIVVFSVGGGVLYVLAQRYVSDVAPRHFLARHLSAGAVGECHC